MEDVTTPLAQQPSHTLSLQSQLPPPLNQLPGIPASVTDQQLPDDLARSLTLINQEVEKVKLAMAHGQDPSILTANLVQLTNHLATTAGHATTAAAAAAVTSTSASTTSPSVMSVPQRDQTATPSSQGVSPISMQASPAISISAAVHQHHASPLAPAPQHQQPQQQQHHNPLLPNGGTALSQLSANMMSMPPPQQTTHLQPSPVVSRPMSGHQHQGLLPSLPVDASKRPAPPPLDMSQVNITQQLPTPDYMVMQHQQVPQHLQSQVSHQLSPQVSQQQQQIQQAQLPYQPHQQQQHQQQGQHLEPPPMIHSHSFPNGHQLPSQIHAPNTPVSASPSFVNAIGIPHAPVISSPLAAMPVSRPPSPPRQYNIPDELVAPSLSLVHSESDLLHDPRHDGRPVINRTRSASIQRPKVLAGMTGSVPPSAWQSRANSPEDDYETEDEGPRKPKRRRSSTEVADISLSAADISPDIKIHLDEIFRDFLNMVCSDRESPFLWSLCLILGKTLNVCS